VKLEILSELIEREVSFIQNELREYKNPELLWKTKDGISNSGGNIALHIAGNLQHFVGAILGNTAYVRDRNYEFGTKDVPLHQLMTELETAKKVVAQTLSGLSERELKAPFSINVFKRKMTTEWFLLHLLSHTSYHLGQIGYHRRMI